MSQSGVSTGFAKCFIVFMAVVILLQGVIYLGLAIWGITLRTCSTEITDITQDPLKFAMDTIYFANTKCGDPSIKVGFYGEVGLEVNWNESEKITNREYIFFIIYAAFSGLWIITSLLIIATICSTTTKVISTVCYWPWFVFVICGSILDVVATVYHVIDITHSTTFQDTFAYVGFSLQSNDNTETIQTYLETFDPYFVTPAIILTCLSCRLVVIWLLNIFGVSFSLSLSRVLYHENYEKSKVGTSQTEIKPTVSKIEHVATNQPNQLLYVDPCTEVTRPRPLPIIIPELNSIGERQDSPINALTDRSFVRTPIQLNPTYRTTDAHPDLLNYPVVETTETRALSPDSRKSTTPTRLAITSPLNNRYSESTLYQSPNQQNQRVSEELRSQLPWSYTSILAKPPTPPRKPQVQIYPQIPEPDYTDQ